MQRRKLSENGSVGYEYTISKKRTRARETKERFSTFGNMTILSVLKT